MMMGPSLPAERHDIEVRHRQPGHVDRTALYQRSVPLDSEFLKLAVLFLLIY